MGGFVPGAAIGGAVGAVSGVIGQLAKMHRQLKSVLLKVQSLKMLQ